MRNTDQQLREIRARSEKLKKKQTSRRVLVLEALSACACLVLIAVISRTLPAVSGGAAFETSRYGSLILSVPSLGYVIIGALAFLLGICLTLLCVHLARREREDDGP